MGLRGLVAFVAVIASLGTAHAQRVLKQEPPPGGLDFREVVFVDDGSCPPGQNKRVSGARGAAPAGSSGSGDACRGPDDRRRYRIASVPTISTVERIVNAVTLASKR